MLPDPPVDLDVVRSRLVALRPEGDDPPELSVVVPVNAQGDLGNVLTLLADLARYDGAQALEVILVVNNFAAEDPPAEIERLRALGVDVVAVPNVRRPGEAVGFSARIPGVRAARAASVVLFDADCRIPDATALLDWYAWQFREGAQAAYTHVDYYGHERTLSLRFRFAVHHGARWVKRRVLGVPTTRGSNYAVNRDAMLELYANGLLADEMNVGPTFKRLKGRVAYSGRRKLVVLTSARMFRSGWRRIASYFWYRLRYNLRVLPIQRDVAARTLRERDPVRRYVDNQPIRDEAVPARVPPR